MSSVDTSRFLRPSDLGNLRRNHRRIQVRRALMVAGNLLLIAAAMIATMWIVQEMRSDRRFAITKIETTGLRLSDAAAVRAVCEQWSGANLFELDIESLRAELTSLPWVEAVTIEKRVPDTLVVRVAERVPVGLAMTNEGLRYVDREGRAFAPIAPSVGNPGLPLVTGKSVDERRRAVSFLETLRADDPDLYSRVSQIEALRPSGFRLFDRDLAARLFVPETGAAESWRRLYALERVESWGPSGLEYADLRFTRRIVVQPRSISRSQSIAATLSTGVALN